VETNSKNVSELKPLEYNPRDITEDGIKDLTESINNFGLAEPIIINTDNIIIGGHARYYVLKQKNEKQCQCFIPNRKLTKKEVDELNIRLNKNVAGKWNFDLLANNFDESKLLEWGFKEFELSVYQDVELANSGSDEYIGMPEFEPKSDELKLIVTFESNEDREKFVKDKDIKVAVMQKITWSTRYPFRERENLKEFRYD
jgi:hypothetical protein